MSDNEREHEEVTNDVADNEPLQYTENEVDEGEGEPMLNNEGEGSIFGDAVYEDSDVLVVCPVCDLHFDVSQFRDHLLHTHPDFVAIWASALFGPLFHQEEYLDYVRGLARDGVYFDDIDIDHMTYEQLLELCEEIGDHKEGITNVEDVLAEVESTDTLLETKCPICLEEFATKREMGQIEKIRSCGHIFCRDCIRTWLTDNKRCPLCKSEAQS